MLAGRAWPVWLAVAVAGVTFHSLWRPAAQRRALLDQATTAASDSLWVERAVAAAAIASHAQPGELIPAEVWRGFLDPAAPARLRRDGRDAFHHLYGPQPSDQAVAVPDETRRRLDSIRPQDTLTTSPIPKGAGPKSETGGGGTERDAGQRPDL